MRGLQQLIKMDFGTDAATVITTVIFPGGSTANSPFGVWTTRCQELD